MDCRGREVTKEIEKSLSSKVLEMDLLLKKTGIENVIIMGEIFTGNIENSKLEAINYSAINKEIKTVYLWHEGFPEDFAKRTNEKFDVIYFDPPYNSKIYNSVISLIMERNLLNENGYLIVELGYEYYKKFVENFNNIKCGIKIYGETVLIIFEKRNL